MAGVAVDTRDARYRVALECEARALSQEGGQVVLLGSVASGKYGDVLLAIFGERLLFPTDFVGRGDMSRGGLLPALRASANGARLCAAPGSRQARAAATSSAA